MTPALCLGWLGIVRLGMVQTALGAVVVLTTSTLNRVMVVELSLAATIPGLLVGLHYGVQMLRPVWGHRSDVGGRRTPWIIGGVALLGAAGTAAAIATALMAQNFAAGFALSLIAFLLIGVGVGAAGTSLLALLASSVSPERRPAAATIVWLMMIAGMALTAILTGSLLDPFSLPRLVVVTAATGTASLLLAIAALWRVERSISRRDAETSRRATFKESLADAWADPKARLFTLFVFVSMLAYSGQDLILEPFAGLVFGMTPGETTSLAGLQHGGVFAGMIVSGFGGTLLARRFPSVLAVLTVGGCALSALFLVLLALSTGAQGEWPLKANVFGLGFANGAFAVAAIGSMMALAGEGGPSRSGMRMGLWGAAQAIAFGAGGFLGTVAVDLMRAATADVPASYAAVFAGEAVIFLAAAAIALRIGMKARRSARSSQPHMVPAE